MGYKSAAAFPIPFGADGNNVPHDLALFAQHLEDTFAARTYAQITALSGAELWDGRIVYQSDAGTDRPFVGFYVYRPATSSWEPLLTMGTPPAWASPPTYTGTGGDLGAYTYSSRVARFGPLVVGRGSIVLPASGFTRGSGTLLFTLPYPVASTGSPLIGWMQYIDASTSARRTFGLIHSGVGSMQATGVIPGGVSVPSVSTTQPVTIDVSDAWHYRFRYFTTAVN
jgi:hypothetical protein